MKNTLDYMLYYIHNLLLMVYCIEELKIELNIVIFSTLFHKFFLKKLKNHKFQFFFKTKHIKNNEINLFY